MCLKLFLREGRKLKMHQIPYISRTGPEPAGEAYSAPQTF